MKMSTTNVPLHNRHCYGLSTCIIINRLIEIHGDVMTWKRFLHHREFTMETTNCRWITPQRASNAEPQYFLEFSLNNLLHTLHWRHNEVASRITSLVTVYSIAYSGADQWKHQNSASLAFVRRIHRRPVNSPHKGPVTRKMLPFDDVIMSLV